MNYQIHYQSLIERAKNRALEGYSERHHIIPRCIGGNNSTENIVRLTPQEHYVAHLLLMKAMPDEPKLVHAAWTMVRKSKFVAGRAGGKVYAWLRIRYAEMMRRKMTGTKQSAEQRAKKSKSAKKIKISADQRKRMVEASVRARSTSEFRARISADMTRRWQSPEFRAAKVASTMNKRSQQRSIALRARWNNPEYRRRMTDVLAKYNIGRNVSAVTKEKMSAAHKGKKLPPEQREKMRIAALAWRKARREAAAT